MGRFDFTLDDVAEWTGIAPSAMAKQCHAVSLALVKSGKVGKARVARGFCRGVGGQHSWVVLGWDCYADDAVICDPTLWSYDSTVKDVWFGSATDRRHLPHGAGSIWRAGRPADPTGPIVELPGVASLSRMAQDFLSLLGPLDRQGWGILANLPMGGWPSGEIIEAMYKGGMEELIPIDIVGMVTDLNPGGLYF